MRKLLLVLAVAVGLMPTMASAHAYTATCAIGTYGNPPLTDLNVNGTGYTPGHTYYARVAQPDGGGTAQVLYQSFHGEFFFQDTNLEGNLPPGTYTVKIYQSVASYRAGNASIAGCSAVAP